MSGDETTPPNTVNPPVSPTDENIPDNDVPIEPHALPPFTHDEVTRVARGIVTNELLIVDPALSEWMSLFLFYGTMLRAITNIGLIVVPVGPHLHMSWINGIAPGFVVKLEVIPQENIPALADEVERMAVALGYQQQDTASDTLSQRDDDGTLAP